MNSISGTTTALQQEFLYDDTKSYFQPLHKRGQRNAKVERLVYPTSSVNGNVNATSVQFQIIREGHLLNTITLYYECVLTPAFLAALTGGLDPTAANAFYSLTLQDLPAFKGLEQVEINYGGDNIVRVTRDELRLDFHAFMSDTQKKAAREMATDYRHGNEVRDDSYNFDIFPNVAANYATVAYANDAASLAAVKRAPNGWARPLMDQLGCLRYNSCQPIDQVAAISSNVTGSAQLVTNSAGNTRVINTQIVGGPLVAEIPNSGDVFNVALLGAISNIVGTNGVPLFTATTSTVLTNAGGGGYNTAVLTPATVASGITLRWFVKIPYSHDGSSDRNLPIGLLDQDPVVNVKFAHPSRLVLGLTGTTPAGAGAAALASLISGTGIQFQNPVLRVEFRDQPAPLQEMMAKLPSIVYPLSHVIRERFVLPANSPRQVSFDVQGLRGIAHTVFMLIRPVAAVDGSQTFAFRQHLANGIPGIKLYDDDWLDMNQQTTVNAGVVAPGSQRQLDTWDLTSNGERITGKIPIDARYNLTQYKQLYFPGTLEGIRNFAHEGSGYNAYVHTWGLDGARESVGTGTINFDALTAVKLNLTFRSPGGHLNFQAVNTYDQYVDLFLFTANFTNVANGNWWRQLA